MNPAALAPFILWRADWRERGIGLGAGLAIVSPDGKEGMLQHARECHAAGVRSEKGRKDMRTRHRPTKTDEREEKGISRRRYGGDPTSHTPAHNVTAAAAPFRA